MNTVGKFVCTKGELPTSINYSVEQKSKGIRYVSYFDFGRQKKSFCLPSTKCYFKFSIGLVWFICWEPDK